MRGKMIMPATPIVLNLYDPETEELLETKTRSFIPWKMLKKAMRLNKTLGAKPADQYEDEDVDEITFFIMGVFPGLSVEILDEQSDLTEMMSVLKAIVSRAKGIMDPTLPPRGS